MDFFLLLVIYLLFLLTKFKKLTTYRIDSCIFFLKLINKNYKNNYETRFRYQNPSTLRRKINWIKTYLKNISQKSWLLVLK